MPKLTKTLDPRLQAVWTGLRDASRTGPVTNTRHASETAPSQVRGGADEGVTGVTGSAGGKGDPQLARLLDEVEHQVRRFVMFGSEHHYTSVALWVVATHLLDESQFAPRLMFRAASLGSGKSTAVDVVRPMTANPIGSSNMSASSMFRLIEASQPTLFLDEMDNSGINGEDGSMMRTVLNSGFKRGPESNIYRAERVKGDFTPRPYNCFAMACSAGNGTFPATLNTRSLVVSMKPMTPREAERFEEHDDEVHSVEGDDIAQRLAEYAEGIEPGSIRSLDPEMPITGRDRDKWRFLLRIAERAGGRWPGVAHDACLHMCSRTASDRTHANEATILLRDLRTVFAYLLSEDDDGITTDRILKALRDPDGDWSTTMQLVTSTGEEVHPPLIDHRWGSDSEGLDENRLYRILRESFELESKRSRRFTPRGNGAQRGLRVDHLLDPFERSVFQ